MCIYQGLTHLAAPHQIKLSKNIHNFAYRSIPLQHLSSLQVIPCIGLCLLRSTDNILFQYYCLFLWHIQRWGKTLRLSARKHFRPQKYIFLKLSYTWLKQVGLPRVAQNDFYFPKVSNWAKGEQLSKYQLFCIMEFTTGVWMIQLAFFNIC